MQPVPATRQFAPVLCTSFSSADLIASLRRDKQPAATQTFNARGDFFFRRSPFVCNLFKFLERHQCFHPASLL